MVAETLLNLYNKGNMGCVPGYHIPKVCDTIPPEEEEDFYGAAFKYERRKNMNKKKCFSVLLSAVLCLSTLGFNTFAAEQNSEITPP